MCVNLILKNLLASTLLSQMYEDQDTQNHNFTCRFVWVLSLSVTLREEHKLQEFDNSVLRRIFGPKSEEVTGEWRRLHKDDLHYPYFSPNKMGVIKLRK